MTNKKRSALFGSIISLTLCVTMLLGTTFAWFTDSVTSGLNKIEAGNLDIEVYYKDASGNNQPIENSPKLFGDVALWEPGAVAYEELTIKNEGSLALKYKMAINFTNENNLEGHKLSEVLKVAVLEGHKIDDNTTRDEIINQVKNSTVGTELPMTSFTTVEDDLLAGESKKVTLVVYWEPNTAAVDNLYNVKDGKETSDGLPLHIDMGLFVTATQLTHESDSFDENYDKDANYSPDVWTGGTSSNVPSVDPTTNTITITTADELAAFAQSVNSGKTYNGVIVQLASDINLGNHLWTPIGNSHTLSFQGTFDGQGHTISNLNVVDADGAGLFGYVTNGEIKNVNIVNANIESNHFAGVIAGHVYGKIENCSVDQAVVVCEPELIGATYDNGDKAGGIVGWINNVVLVGNKVTNTTVSAYRDLGGLAGYAGNENGVAYAISNNTVSNVTLVVNPNKAYGTASGNADAFVGKTANDVSTDNTNTKSGNIEYTRTLYHAAQGETVTVSGSQSPFMISGNGTIVLNNVTVGTATTFAATETQNDTSAIIIDPNSNAKIVVDGTVSLTGGTSGSGILVPAGATLDLSGTGSLTAIGNAGTEDKDTSEGGNGIGGASASITIENTTITNVQGGYVQPNITTDHGKGEPEGGAAIGSMADGAVITLNEVTIENAEGGSKSAGIGASYHTGVTVNITDSTIEKVVGGNASAGIGGSRVRSDNSVDQDVTINIKDSTIVAQGGDYGAGIGSGYDTYCHTPENFPICTINITGDSIITATGGKYAAGIGTGYHAGGLDGKIENSVTVVATSSEKFYKNTYTQAQDVGFGVIDPARDGLNNNCSFDYKGTTVTVPSVQTTTTE